MEKFVKRTWTFLDNVSAESAVYGYIMSTVKEGYNHKSKS